MSKFTLDWKQYAALARQAAAEGCVLLENKNNTLPLSEGEKCAVFGRTQFEYYKSGTGSGGLVNTSYVHDLEYALNESSLVIDEEVKNAYKDWLKEHPFDLGNGWAQEPWCQEEMPLSDELVSGAASRCQTALIVIGRTAGEDRDNAAEKGSWYLTDGEEAMLQTVCRHFSRTVVLLNVGNIIDMSFVDRYAPSSVLYIWQGGMEGGCGAVDVLTGKVPASGRLSDTIAYHIDDYPSTRNFGCEDTIRYEEDIYVGYRYFETFAKNKVRYPFGYGLSYTAFDVQASLDMCSLPAGLAKGEISMEDSFQVNYDVTNTGDVAGKETVQFYVQKPQGVLGKPSRELIRFTKTELLEAGEGESGILAIDFYALASYDDSGITGHAFSYVLEEGTYTIFAGTNVRDAKEIGSFALTSTVVLQELAQQLAPRRHLERITPKENEDGTFTPVIQAAPVYLQHYKEDTCPQCADYTGDKGYSLDDVKSGIVSMDEFLAQLTDLDLCHMVKGEGMSSPKVTPGTAAAFGGLTPALTHFGIPAGCCTDGPSGLRMDCGTNAFSLPGGTLLACTFNTSLNADLFEMEGLEMRNNHIESLLGPGMNIHRCPLNGRNFEYFSEDPLLSGAIATAQLEGMGRAGVTGTIKHFCGNNQEYHRRFVDSVISERALREIYLKGFEIAVRSGCASSIMTTYGSVNGLWTAGNPQLNTDVLRGEWGFDGIVMTDWWAEINNAPGDKPSREKFAAMVLAQNDIYMVTSDTTQVMGDLEAVLASGRLERRHLVRCAANICHFLMNSPALLRLTGKEPEIELVNVPENAQVTSMFDITYYDVIGTTTLPLTDISSEKGDSHMFGINTEGFGTFRISITASSESTPLAQMPVSVFVDNQLFGTYSFNGSEGKEVTRSREGGVFGFHHYVRLYFGQGGLNPISITFEPVKIVTSFTDKD